MLKYLQKNQKKVLAVLGVLLMIAFVATLGPRVPGQGSRENPVVAHLGQSPVYESQMQAAKSEWSWLAEQGYAGMFRQSESLAARMLTMALVADDPFARQEFQVQFEAEQIADALVKDIEKHPELFFLLHQESIRNGLEASDDEAASFMVNQLRIPMESARAQGGLVVAAVKAMLSIGNEIRALRDSMKVSQPEWEHEVARGFQAVRLDLVDFHAGDFERNVPAPTPQQLREQFERFKNTPPRQAEALTTADDPLGFGYQVPTRVRLQYLEIPHAQVVDAVLGTPEKRYEWTVKAAQYYTAHPDEFRNTPPATTQSATRPTTVPLQPAIKPFDQVSEQILQKLVDADVQKLTEQIEQEVKSRLATDWTDIRRHDPAATRPATTQPAAATQSAVVAAQPADPLTTLARLEQMRAGIDQKFHVAVQLNEINDWQDETKLSALPGIGSAATTDGERFPQYAVNFVGQPHLLAAAPLQIWEPSQVLTDASQNAYVFHLTAAEPAHAPPDMAPLAAQIERDWKLAQAYDQARKAAQTLLDAAKSIGLAQAARTASVNLFSTGLFAPRSSQPIPGYLLTDRAAERQFREAAQKLLEQATPADKHPETLAELPTAQRVVVLELAGAQLEQQEWIAQLAVVFNQRQAALPKMALAWFNYDAVVSRLAYRPEAKS